MNGHSLQEKRRSDAAQKFEIDSAGSACSEMRGFANVPRTVTQEAWELVFSRPTLSFDSAKALEYQPTRLLGDRLVQREGFACDPSLFEQAWNTVRVEQVKT